MGYPREEIEEMLRRYMAANVKAEKDQDWKPIADFYTEDARYGWSVDQNEEVVLQGREEIRRVVMDLEMVGFGGDGWMFPYQRHIIDTESGEVVGFYRYYTSKRRADGSIYEAKGIHGSWFHYAGNFKWDWQRDFLDYGNMRALMGEMMAAGELNPVIDDRFKTILKLKAEGGMPEGHYPIDKGPFPLWELAPGLKRFSDAVPE
jgi:hypothetical protein